MDETFDEQAKKHIIYQNGRAKTKFHTDPLNYHFNCGRFVNYILIALNRRA